jgi:cobalt/nickel transport system ATP-binding protein
MNALVEVRNLSYSHVDGTRALDNVNLDVYRGENLTVFGPNGSGKTTLLLHLNGTLSATGRIRIAGVDLTKKTLPDIRRRVGLVFQESDDQLFMPTVLEDVMFGPLNLGWSYEKAEKAAGDILRSVGIDSELHSRPPFHLSSGEKRRVALAGVLVMQPELLLLDEPTTSLDPPAQRGLVQLLDTLPQTKIIATHDVGFARALGRRALFLDKGRIIADGDVISVAERFGWNPYP